MSVCLNADNSTIIQDRKIPNMKYITRRERLFKMLGDNTDPRIRAALPATTTTIKNQQFLYAYDGCNCVHRFINSQITE